MIKYQFEEYKVNFMKLTEFENLIEKKPLGQILQEAALISSGQIELALMEQSSYYQFKIGEILALHGWIPQKTADFFAEPFSFLVESPIRRKLGNYLCEAGLLSEFQVQDILREQKQLGVKFGSIAVLKGLIKPETLSFFLKYFFPENLDKVAYKYLNEKNEKSAHKNCKPVTNVQNTTYTQNKTTISRYEELSNGKNSHKNYKPVTNVQKTTYSQGKTISSYEELTEEGLDDIPWIN